MTSQTAANADPVMLIESVEAIEYRMPLKRPYGTARGVTTGSVNFIARLWVSSSAGSFEGIGESQPRHRLTAMGSPPKTGKPHGRSSMKPARCCLDAGSPYRMKKPQYPM
jgi:hypothetical protein